MIGLEEDEPKQFRERMWRLFRELGNYLIVALYSGVRGHEPKSSCCVWRPPHSWTGWRLKAPLQVIGSDLRVCIMGLGEMV